MSTTYHSAQYAWKFIEGAQAAVIHKDRITVTPSTPYVVDWWWKATAHENMTMEARLDWYGEAGYLSSSYVGQIASSGVATDWQQMIATVTSPANATQVVLMIGADIGSGGVGRAMYLDDARLYVLTTVVVSLAQPRAYLWSRDLTTYDYILRTADLEPGLQRTLTTRDLANAVVAKYSTDSYTAVSEDAASEALYRRRDHLISAGSVALVNAQAQRDVYLSSHVFPGTEIGSFRVSRRGAVRTETGQAVDPARLRAGDRLKIIDGHLAGTVIMLSEVDWSDGVATCRPESYEDLTRVLARV